MHLPIFLKPITTAFHITGLLKKKNTRKKRMNRKIKQCRRDGIKKLTVCFLLIQNSAVLKCELRGRRNETFNNSCTLTQPHEILPQFTELFCSRFNSCSNSA